MNATDIAKDLETGAEFVGNLTGIADKVLPWANLILGWFPGVTSVIAGLQIAAPIIHKISVAAPIAAKLIAAGEPIAASLDKAAPELLAHFKQLYAVLANHDPLRPEIKMTAGQVTDKEALVFAGPWIMGRPWTLEEQNRFWDRQDGKAGY